MTQLRQHPGSLSCPRCGRPVFADERLHLDHDEHGGYLPGLSCEPCNIKAAAAKAHARRYRRPAQPAAPRCQPCPSYTPGAGYACQYNAPGWTGRCWLPVW